MELPDNVDVLRQAIDIWMIVCLVFVFSSLIEYAFVNVLSRRSAGRRRAPPPGPGQSTAAANATTSSAAGSPPSLAPAVQTSHGVSIDAVLLFQSEYRADLLSCILF